MKVIHTEPNLGHCDFLKFILESHGIECFIKNEQGSLTAGMGYPRPEGSAMFFSWPELWIANDSDCEQALNLINESAQGETTEQK